MNSFEKQSYLSFLGLYLISTFVLITMGAFWYYTGQLKTQDNLLHYKMLHVSDDVSGKVIHAHMSGSSFELPGYNDYTIALLSADKRLMYGTLPEMTFPIQKGLYENEAYDVLVTTGTNEHLGIHYVVVSTTQFSHQKKMLRHTVLKYYIAALIFVTIVGSLLSHLFLEPIRGKVETIERFIKDITHELNTPISALHMSAQRAAQKGQYDERTIRNISASTKQLYDIYKALSYINFNKSENVSAPIDLAYSLQSSISYFDEVASSKSLHFIVETEPTMLKITPQQATMLINNLLSNAIKYSPVNSHITVLLKNRVLMVQDEGIGIEPEKLSRIFDRFTRATDYAGGFGLGLSIVKSICDERDIKVKVTSEVGHGTTVMMVLPDLA
jgi:two-component system OmpR family sensor kinase